jgi:predicted phosphohydrolase
MNKQIISLGSNCYIASYLKENKIKLASYPFDWIFSYPLDICHMINDNFNEFLNKENYLIKDEVITYNYHKMYIPDLRMFNHHNPFKNDDHEYFKRCINRLMDVLKNPVQSEIPLVFVMAFFENEIKNELDNIFKLNKLLETFRTNYKIVCFFHMTRKYQNVSEISHYKNITVIQIMTYDVNNGTDFINTYDKRLFDQLFKKYV